MTSALAFLCAPILVGLLLMSLGRAVFLAYQEYRRDLITETMRTYSAARIEWREGRGPHPEIPKLLGGARRVIYLPASTPPAEPTTKAA